LKKKGCTVIKPQLNVEILQVSKYKTWYN